MECILEHQSLEKMVVQWGIKQSIKNKPIKFERGKLITHKVLDTHEITKCEKGTRWSLHFGINKDYNKKLI